MTIRRLDMFVKVLRVAGLRALQTVSQMNALIKSDESARQRMPCKPTSMHPGGDCE